jgi:hypothetical protein
MKISLIYKSIRTIIIFSAFSVMMSSCLKTSTSLNYPYGFFPDSAVNLAALNSVYDDYNSSGYQLNGTIPLIFSSNRESEGGQFDLVQGRITFSWDQKYGSLILTSEITTDDFYKTLISTMVTSGNDFGPFRIFNTDDGYEYMILASQTANGDLDLKYCKYLSYYYGDVKPLILGPYPVNLINTTSDDAYLSLDPRLDTAYFTSNLDGNFDIYYKVRPDGSKLDEWLNQTYSVSEKVDSINSTADDKCPTVFNKVMIFSSNRPGGYGGYDLYYSVLKNGKWNAPVNLGSRINTAYDEYRPLLGNFPDFTNLFVIFSSNRSGGKGGFDLYFTGFTIPTK